MSDISLLSDAQIQLYEKIYTSICNELLTFYKANQNKSFSLLLSGGYDSRFILYACLDLNIPITRCYTFSIENRLSTDAILAEQICKAEHVDFQCVRIPTKSDIVIGLMEILARDFKCRKKTDFECSLPLYCLYQTIKEDIILVGSTADDYFGLTRRYGQKFKNLPDALTKFKECMNQNPNNNQTIQKALFDAHFNKHLFDAFNTDSVFKAFENTTWEELNKPFVKGPLYSQFKDRYDAIKPYHANYQCGDSGIRELCADVLLQSKYNRKKYTSVVGCYNEIIRSINSGKRKSLI